MPYIHIRVASEYLSPRQIQQLSMGTTQLMKDRLHKRPELTVVTVETLAPNRWFLAGQAIPSRAHCTRKSRPLRWLVAASPMPAGACAAMADIKITHGTNTTEEKATFLAEFHQLLRDVLGPLDIPAYVVIDEVAGSDWGYDGLSQTQRQAMRIHHEATMQVA